MEICEIIAPAVSHNETNNECPFCPPPEENEKKFTTYAGIAKSENKLKDIMADPSILESKDSGARPKKGESNQQQPSSTKLQPVPPLEHPIFKAYTYEAHHLIPGKEKVAPNSTTEVMNGHPIEKWIIEGDKIDRDTGYSINNSDNGVWLPSAPLNCKKNRANPKPERPWASEAKAKNDPSALNLDEKNEVAIYAMNKGAGQFHYGQHKVLNEEGIHYTYAKEVKDRLTALEKEFAAWSLVCLCDKEQSNPPDPPFKPTWKINEKLDLISMWIEIDIHLMPTNTWTYFISTFAMRAAKNKCKRL